VFDEIMPASSVILELGAILRLLIFQVSKKQNTMGEINDISAPLKRMKSGDIVCT